MSKPDLPYWQTPRAGWVPIHAVKKVSSWWIRNGYTVELNQLSRKGKSWWLVARRTETSNTPKITEVFLQKEHIHLY
jgi:hypothetical protein